MSFLQEIVEASADSRSVEVTVLGKKIRLVERGWGEWQDSLKAARGDENAPSNLSRYWISLLIVSAEDPETGLPLFDRTPETVLTLLSSKASLVNKLIQPLADLYGESDKAQARLEPSLRKTGEPGGSSASPATEVVSPVSLAVKPGEFASTPTPAVLPQRSRGRGRERSLPGLPEC